MPARKFADCRLVKIYLELVEYDELLRRARMAETTLSDYARKILTNSDMPGNSGIRVAGRGAVSERDSGGVGALAVAGKSEGATEPSRKERACKHGVAKGWHCWQCGGMAVINAHD